MRKDPDRAGGRLSHDELKAAEAAFQGRSFNEAWSQAARTVYDGILAAKIKLSHGPFTHGLRAPNRDPQGAQELVGAGRALRRRQGIQRLMRSCSPSIK